MEMVRFDGENESFTALEENWQKQCAKFGESFDEFAVPSIAHAREICNGTIPSPKYGIYGLKSRDNFECLAHINVARLPKTSGITMRVVWVLLAPIYDFSDATPDQLAQVAASLFSNIILLAKGKGDPIMASDHIKVHLSGLGDRRFFEGMAWALPEYEVAIRGNWLHMDSR